MIEAKESLVGNISQTQEINGKVNKEVIIIEPKLQEKEATPTEQTQIITPDTNFDGISKMTINPIPSEYVVPSGTLNITQNGEYNVKNYETVNTSVAGDPSAYFNVQPETISTVSQWGTTKFMKDISNVELVIPNSVSSLSNMFNGYTYEYAPKIIASNITNMSGVFMSCTNLIKADLSGIDVSGCSDFTQMFTSCSALREVDLSNFKPTNANAYYSFTQIFQNCSALTEVDLSAIPNRIRGGFLMAFRFCTSLQKIDLRKINLSSSNLSNIFGISTNDNVPYNCLIIVADDTDKAKLNTDFPNYTNVKTVEEYNAERE